MKATLTNKFKPVMQDTPPVVDCKKRESIKLPTASEEKAWKVIQEKLVAALEELQYLLCVESDQPIDAVVGKYEEVVYEKLVECCEVHSPKQRDHPQRAAAKRGKAGKKELWLRERKERARAAEEGYCLRRCSCGSSKEEGGDKRMASNHKDEAQGACRS